MKTYILWATLLIFYTGILITKTPLSAADSLEVAVSNITINPADSIRGLNAAFPNPVISTITVLDDIGNPVFGLADTSTWIGPNDINNRGDRIRDAWHPLAEYHEENPSLPASQNLFDQFPDLLFTEVRETLRVPSSSMIVMDMSSSMRDEIGDARKGAVQYISQMRETDYCGIVFFSRTILDIVPLTNNADSLIDIVNNFPIDLGTALYDGMMTACLQLKNERGRRAVIVYTDGFNNSSQHTYEAVIDTALVYNLAIFTIAIGEDTEEIKLRTIARSTGGSYFKARTSAELPEVFQRVSSLVKNYYLMAHMSPDPVWNGTWRVVDVTAHAECDGEMLAGRGKGKYFVPYRPRPNDIALTLQAVTDSMVSDGGINFPAVLPSDSLTFQLSVSNSGPYASRNILLSFRMPDSISYQTASLLPDVVADDSLLWNIGELNVNQSIAIDIDCFVSDSIPEAMTQARAFAHGWAPGDSMLENNDASVVIRMLQPPEPIKYVDVAISQAIAADTLIQWGNKLTPAVYADKSYTTTLRIENKSPRSAYDIHIWTTVPNDIQLRESSSPVKRTIQDSLFWNIDSLNALQDLSITLEWQPPDSLSIFPMPVLHVSGLMALNDSLLANNIVDDTVFIMPPPAAPEDTITDLTLNLFSVSDSMIIEDNDTLFIVEPAMEYLYTMRIENHTNFDAKQVQATLQLPDSVWFLSSTQQPINVNDNIITWKIDSIATKAGLEFLTTVRVDSNLRTGRPKLIAIGNVSCVTDTNLQNNTDQDSILFRYNNESPDTSGQKCDLALRFDVAADTQLVIKNASINGVWIGTEFSGEIIVRNQGNFSSRKVQLTFNFIDGFEWHQINPQPDSMRNSTTFWNFPPMQKADEIQVQFVAAITDTNAQFLPQNWVHASVQTANDSIPSNNVADLQLVGIMELPAQRYADMTVTLKAITDSSSFINTDTTKYVHAGEAYSYEIKLRNLSENPAQAVSLAFYPDESIVFKNADVAPKTFTNDSLYWEFESWKSSATQNIHLDVSARNEVRENEFLAAWCRVRSRNDINITNNFSSDTVVIAKNSEDTTIVGERHVDVSIDLNIVGDTTIVSGGVDVQGIFTSSQYPFNLMLHNSGPDTAVQVEAWTIVPDSISFTNWNRLPDRINTDTLFWNVETILPNESTEINGIAHTSTYFPEDMFEITHAAGVKLQYDTDDSNNRTSLSIYGLTKKQQQQNGFVDVAISQKIMTDSIVVIAGDTLHFVSSGGLYQVQLNIKNVVTDTARQIQVQTIFPEQLVSITQSVPGASQAGGGSNSWNWDVLLPGEMRKIQLFAQAKADLPGGIFQIEHRSEVAAINEDADYLMNNTDQGALYVIHQINRDEQWLPGIEAIPPVVDVGQEITLRVLTIVPAIKWDVWIYQANAVIDSSFADAFIASNSITPGEWLTIDEPYKNTRLYKDKEVEKIIFELRVVDIFGTRKKARAQVWVHSGNQYVLDRNVFRPATESEIEIRFKLSTNRSAQIDVFDISGAHITQLANKPFQAGWNTYYWNGITDDGHQVGSGLYLITIRSGNLNEYKKVMVVR
ncbi:VWA domain-containing protein [candidate division KSB1 bacterium]|nr:VWA domain-containing protein [candidate division KSB1 bacterium]